MTFPKIGTSETPVNNRPSSYNNGTATINFTYDNSGNMTAAGATTYQWDGANRLKSVNGGTSGSYGFDGNGKRVKKTEGGQTIYYVYSTAIGWPVMEVTSSGVHRAYVMNGASVIAERSYDGNFYWVHKDHLGSGRKMTNTSGNLTYRAEYDPYGKLLYEWSASNQPNLNTKKFTGYERDAATGLDYAEARFYSSEWGRFMSPDPAGLSAATQTSPKSFNRYSYVEGDPVNYNDPEGLTRCGDLPIISGRFVGQTMDQAFSGKSDLSLIAQLIYHEGGAIYESDRTNINGYWADLIAIGTAIINQWAVDNEVIKVYRPDGNGNPSCPLGKCGHRSIFEIFTTTRYATDGDGDAGKIFDSAGNMRAADRKRIQDALNTDVYQPPLIGDRLGGAFGIVCEGLITSMVVTTDLLNGIIPLAQPPGLTILFWNQVPNLNSGYFYSQGYTGIGKVREKGETFWALPSTPPVPSRVLPGDPRTPPGRRGPKSRGII